MSERSDSTPTTNGTTRKRARRTSAPSSTRSTAGGRRGNDLDRRLARWWERSLAQVLDEPVVVLEQAVHDYYRACVARLMQRLLNPRTPERVKDAIALRGVPLLAIELRGRLPEAPGPDAHAQAETAALLEAYGVPGPETPQ